MASKRTQSPWIAEWETIRTGLIDGTLSVPDPLLRISSILLAGMADHSAVQQTERQLVQKLMHGLWGMRHVH